MADRYWVGGTANWDGTAGTKWAATSGAAGGASVPTTADDVFLDANSGANTVTIATGNTGCKSLTCTGFTGTLAGSATLTIAGGFTLVAGMTCTATGAWTITGSGTLTSGGKTIPFIRINNSGITVDQGDAFTFTGSSSTNIYFLDLIQGTYNTNNYNLTWSGSNNIGGGLSVTNNPVLTRAINLGSSTITATVNSNNNLPFFNNSSSTNLTFNAGTSTLKFINNSNNYSAPNFIGGGLTFYNVEFSNLATNNTTISIRGANTFNNLTFASRTVAGAGFYNFDSNQTINGTLTTSAGTDASMRSFLQSNTFGTARTLTCAAVSLTDADFQDITIAGAASPASGTRIGNCKGNSGITFDAAKTVYWNLAGAQNFNAVGWAPSSNGTPAANNFPLAQDTAVFDNAGSVTGTITINAIYNIGTLDMSARTSAMTLANAQTTNIYGNYLNGTGTTLSGAGTWFFAGRGSQQVTTNGRTITQRFTLNSPSGTLTLQDAVTFSGGIISSTVGTVFLVAGTLDLNGKTLTMPGSFTTGVGTKNLTFNGGTLVLTSNTNLAFNNVNPTGFTTTAGSGTGTISLTDATGKTFVGAGSTYNCTINQGGAGALTISGSNTFSDITNTYKSVGATTITFTASTTQTFTNFNASGEATRLLTINSSSSGTQATLSKASGTVSVDYLSIRDSNATGGATWDGGTNSVNLGNNTGWILPAAASTGNFFLLFA